MTEDGHAFQIYFTYSFLTLSKVFTKLIPFCFLVATVLTIIKLEKDNELIVIWTSGLNKIYIVNLILRISLIFMFLQLFLTTIVNPKLLNYSRFLLKNSEFQFIPSLLKEKQFNDAIKGLTVFVEEKDEGNKFKNIFIRDDGNNLSTIGSSSSNFAFTVLAKSGNVSEDKKSLVLYDGNIQKLTKNQDTVSIIKFEKTVLNFTGLTTKSISEPKMQETSTLKIFNCIKNNYTSIDMHNCTNSKQSKMDTKIEINKRFGMPVFIPLISLICCFLLSSRKDKKLFDYYKYIYFLVGVIILIFAETTVRYSGLSWNHTLAYYLSPILMIPIIYFILIKRFKYENLS